MVDHLTEIWDRQRDLNVHTFDKNQSRCPVMGYKGLVELGKRVRSGDATKAERQLVETWLRNYVLAIQQECAELNDSTNWKWWRSNVDKFDHQNICVELVDILHFWVSACQVAGLSPEDVVRMYHGKREVNLQRQDDGYVEKNEEDSRHIK